MASLRDSAPYPWPYDGDADPRRMAVVVTGAQPAWIDRSQDAAAVTEVITAVAQAVRGGGGHVVVVHHVAGHFPHRPLPPAPGAPVAIGAFPAGPGDIEIVAHGVNGFFASPLDSELRRRGIDRLVLTGYGAEATVDTTLRGANDRGYECLVLTDAYAPFDHDTAKHALSSVTMSGGIFGAIGTSADLLATLSPVSSRPPTPLRS
jgi:nicotinamidase-related amidase